MLHAFNLHRSHARAFCHLTRFGECAARRQLNIDLCLCAVGSGHKAGGQQRHQCNRTRKKYRRREYRSAPMTQTPLHRRKITLHCPAVFGLAQGCRFQQIRSHHRRQHPRNHQGREDGQHRGPAKLFEKQSRHAAHERGRQKNRNQRKCGCDHRHADFVCCVDGRLHRRFAHAQMARNVFNFDNGIVDQYADDQRQ